MNQPHGRVERWTPEIAQYALSRNPRNRPLSRATVSRYADAMRNRRWALTGEPIIIDWNGNLHEGMHRCWGIVESGATVEVFVVRDVDPATWPYINIGKPRSAVDVLKVDGVVKRAGDLSATYRVLNAYALARSERTGIFPALKRSKIENYDLPAWVEAHPNALRFVQQADRIANVCPSLTSRSAITAALYVAARHRDDVAEFIQQVLLEVPVEPGSPAMILRNKPPVAGLSTSGQDQQAASFVVFAKALNGARKLGYKQTDLPDLGSL